jgi:phosphatidylglycerol:prolipoprotein diacylglycerol transferase
MHAWLDLPGVDWSLRTNHLLLLVTAVLCGWHGARRLRQLDPPGWRRARRGLVLLAVAPWIGGHVHFLVNNWRYACTSPALLFVPWNGLHAGGAIIALALTAPLALRRFTCPLGRVADTLVPTVGIGIVLGRLGCFAEGCCFGSVCRQPWCVSFPAGTSAYELHSAQGQVGLTGMHSAPVHPLQLYFAGVGVMLIVLSRWWRGRARYEGQIALLSLVIFSVAAAALESLRAGDDTRVYWGPLPQLQWTAIAMAIGSLAALRAAERRSPSSSPPHREGEHQRGPSAIVSRMTRKAAEASRGRARNGSRRRGR